MSFSTSQDTKEELLDPYSDPRNPRTITYGDIKRAYDNIHGEVINTPCQRSKLSSLLEMDIYLKRDNMQCTGSVKERGARNALVNLTDSQKQKGVITASIGNHAEALCYHGLQLGIPITVVMPIVVPITRITRCFKFNANVIVHGKDMSEAKRIALKLSKVNNFVYIDSCDHPDVIAGNGTLGLEITNEVHDADAVVFPVGGGGLIAGSAIAIKTRSPKVKIIGVESIKCPGFSTSLRLGKPTPVKVQPSLAEGLGHSLIGCNAFKNARSLIDKMVVVNENWIALAILRLVEEEKVIVEGAGAIALAAALSGKLKELKGKSCNRITFSWSESCRVEKELQVFPTLVRGFIRSTTRRGFLSLVLPDERGKTLSNDTVRIRKTVVLVLTGGNIDISILGRSLERGLAADGRLIKVTVTVNDQPGGFAVLTRYLAGAGASLKGIDTIYTDDVCTYQISVLCETRDRAHSAQVKKLLMTKYECIDFVECEMDNEDDEL